MIDWAHEIAVAASVKQRLAAVDREGLWRHYTPEPAATTQQVAEAESALGHSLDSEYRAFLLHANGWRGFLQGVDLFGTTDLLRSPKRSFAEELLADLEEARELTGFSTKELLPIGVSQTEIDLLVLTRPSSEHPGLVLWIAGAPIERYPTFVHFFRGMIALNRYEADSLERGPP